MVFLLTTALPSYAKFFSSLQQFKSFLMNNPQVEEANFVASRTNKFDDQSSSVEIAVIVNDVVNRPPRFLQATWVLSDGWMKLSYNSVNEWLEYRCIDDREAILYVGGAGGFYCIGRSNVESWLYSGLETGRHVCVFGRKPCCCNNMQQDKKCFVASAS